MGIVEFEGAGGAHFSLIFSEFYNLHRHLIPLTLDFITYICDIMAVINTKAILNELF